MTQKGVIAAEDILRLTRARPFVPFRIHMSDGAMHEIPHPEFAIVSKRQVMVGEPSDQIGLAKGFHLCAILHITKLEVLAEAG